MDSSQYVVLTVGPEVSVLVNGFTMTLILVGHVIELTRSTLAGSKSSNSLISYMPELVRSGVATTFRADCFREPF